MSRVMFPDLRESTQGKDFDPKLVGSHSLKAWGHRIGKILKLTYGEEEDAWDSYNEEMKKYCGEMS